MAKSIAIVEDDVFIATDISEMILELGYQLCFIANGPDEAIQYLKKEKPDVILMDIQLNSTIDGVHLAGIIKTEYQIPIIFTTAFTDAATIERVNKISPQGYLVKPYQKEQLKVTLSIALQNKKEIVSTEKDFVFINSMKGSVKINPFDILYIEAYDYYANVYLPNQKLLAKTTLKELLEELNLDYLLRIHKSYAVNIKSVQKIYNNEIYIGETKLPIGRAFKDAVKERIQLI